MRSVFSAVLLAALSLIAIAAPQAPRGPLSKAEVLELVSRSVPNRVVADAVRSYGIAFEPSEQVLKEFRKAGADDAVIRAMRDSWRSEPAKPLSDRDIFLLLAGDVRSEKIANMVQQRGIGFEPTDEYLQRLLSSGAKDELIDALRTAAAKPFSGDRLLQSLASGEDPDQIGKEVKERGIDFDPTDEDFNKLRTAGASEPLLLAIREAKRVKPQVKQILDASESKSPSLRGAEAGVTPPAPTYNPAPDYTPQARRDKIEGEVDLWIVIDSQGNVTDAREVSKPLGDGLDEKAIETVKKWKFKPAIRNGVALSVRVRVEVSFRLYH
jgi:TonB family protein